MKIIALTLCVAWVTISSQFSWHPVIINPAVEAPAFDSEEWSYPWYMIKTDTAFLNLADTITTAIDTVHIPHNAICSIERRNDSMTVDSTRLPFARATSHDDSLSVFIYGKGNAYLEEVHITVIGHLYSVQYDTYDNESGGKYKKSSEGSFKSVSLILNKKSPATGDLLIGTFKFNGTRNETDSTYLDIEGQFAIVVE
ncbi:MAG: hypothetical protein AB8F95_18105 [Bacteroidia bacterium]